MAQIFRGRVVDSSDATLTISVTGDNGKCTAAEKVMRKFGILEIARTGRICLKRGGLKYPADASMDEEDGVKRVKKADDNATNGCVRSRVFWRMGWIDKH